MEERPRPNAGSGEVEVGIEAELLVSLDRVGPQILEFEGSQFIQQADSAAFLMLVN